MSIQSDILDTIGTGGVEVSALRERLGNIGANELDLAVNALMRARRIKIVLNRYEVIPSKRPLGGMPHTGRPPSAEEEAAASLLPVTRVCITCQGPPQALHQFRFVGPGNERAKECNTCHGKKIQAGNPKKRGQVATRLSAEPVVFHSAQRETESPREGGDNRDVSTERHQPSAAASETSESYSRSDPREDARTPARPDVASPHVVSKANGSSGEGLHPCDPPASSSAASLHPVLSDAVLDRVKTQRQMSLNKIALLEVQVANERSRLNECDTFLGLYERFAQGAE